MVVAHLSLSLTVAQSAAQALLSAASAPTTTASADQTIAVVASSVPVSRIVAVAVTTEAEG